MQEDYHMTLEMGLLQSSVSVTPSAVIQVQQCMSYPGNVNSHQAMPVYSIRFMSTEQLQ